MKPPSSGPTAAAIAAAPTRALTPCPRRAVEVAVDERLHGWQQHTSASSAIAD